MSQALQAQVKAPPAIKPIAQSGLLQRTCACGGSPGVDRECAECRSKRLSSRRQIAPMALQTKLTVNKPEDRYEQEANQVAEQVMRMPEPVQSVFTQTNTTSIQRLNPGDKELHHRTERDKDEDEQNLQDKETPGQTPKVTPELQTSINSIRSGGQPLPQSIRSFMERRFGHDFSQVRIHTDAQAAETAQAVHAKAYTLGRDIVFGAGQYIPETTGGKRLLAHELTHVVQQSRRERLNQHEYSFLQRKVSPDIEKIRSDLSFGIFDWAIREKDVQEALGLLGKLNDEDLKDTLANLEDKLINRIFSKISAEDKQKQSDVVDRIKKFRPGKTLLMHIPDFAICERPKKGEWEMAGSFDDLPQLVERVETIAAQFPLKKLGILAHGDLGGVFHIGSTIVNVRNIDSHKSEFVKISGHLTPDADVYIFGCISGVGRAGSALLKEFSLLLPGRRIIGFNVITASEFSAKEPGEPCIWPDIRATDIKSEIFRDKIKTRVPATETASAAKIAKNGKIIKWPGDESEKTDDGTKESESHFFKE